MWLWPVLAHGLCTIWQGTIRSLPWKVLATVMICFGWRICSAHHFTFLLITGASWVARHRWSAAYTDVLHVSFTYAVIIIIVAINHDHQMCCVATHYLSLCQHTCQQLPGPAETDMQCFTKGWIVAQHVYTSCHSLMVEYLSSLPELEIKNPDLTGTSNINFVRLRWKAQC